MSDDTTMPPLPLPPEYTDLPKAEFMAPGLERDRLVGLILDGTKTATAALLIDYEECGDSLPRVGDRSILVDSNEQGVAVLVTVDVTVTRLADVTDSHALAEGEGDTTPAQWRRTHEAYWNSAEYRSYFADPTFLIDDDTLVVFERFRVAERLLASIRKERTA